MSNDFFKKADKGATEVFYFGPETAEDRPFIRVRSSLSKKEVNNLLVSAPSEQKDIKGAFNFFDIFFERVIVDWSYTDDDGNPVPPTLNALDDMDSSAARAIQDKLSVHLNKIIGREVEQAEGESLS